MSVPTTFKYGERMRIRKCQYILFLCSFLYACGGAVKLIDVNKSSSALELSREQQEKIHPKLQLIRDIIEDYEFEKREFDSEMREYRTLRSDRNLYRNDGGLSLAQRQRSLLQIRTKARRFLVQRNRLLKEIEDILKEIYAELTTAQQVAFNELKMPELKIPRSLRPDPHADLQHIPKHLIGVY